MITVRLQYTNINSARALLLAAEEVTFFFFHLISRSHFSHPNFTNCKLHTHMLTDTDLWRVRCYPIDSGITHKVKKTGPGSGPGSSGLGSSVKTSTADDAVILSTTETLRAAKLYFH